MAIPRPTLRQIEDRVEADVASSLGLSLLLRRSVTRALARALALESHSEHGFLERIAKNAVPTTADTQALEEWASVWGITRKPASQASGLVLFTGTGAMEVPVGTILQREDGVRYETQAGGIIGGGELETAVTAQLGGIAGNSAPGTPLSLLSPIAGVDSTALVQADGNGIGIAGGTDVETDAQLLVRLAQAAQGTGQGGSEADWERWALEVPAVTRAWIRPTWMDQPGVTGVLFVLDGDPTSIVPNSTKLAEMQAYLEDTVRRPVESHPLALAPTLKPVDMTIAVTPNLAPVHQAVTDAIEDLLRRESEPGYTLLISHLREAVSTAAGETDSTVNIPTGSVNSLENELIVPGVIGFA